MEKEIKTLSRRYRYERELFLDAMLDLADEGADKPTGRDVALRVGCSESCANERLMRTPGVKSGIVERRRRFWLEENS